MTKQEKKAYDAERYQEKKTTLKSAALNYYHRKGRLKDRSQYFADRYQSTFQSAVSG
jgi:hypothetical protein